MWFLDESDWHKDILRNESRGAWWYVRESQQGNSWLLESTGEKTKLIDDGGFIPAEDSSIPNLALLIAPNRIGMSDFYMLLSEARRVVPAEGLLYLLTKDIRPGFAGLLQAVFGRLRQSPQPLNPEHFVSPEHWQLVEKKQERIRGITLSKALFRRTTLS